MKILLIFAAAENDPLIKNDPFMPLSLPLLAGAAPGHDYVFVDMLSGETPDFNQKYDLVGISYKLTSMKAAYSISKRFRDRGIPVVFGGPQASTLPFEAIAHSDTVVVGEGELLWPILLKDYQNKKPKHFYVCSPNKFPTKNYSVYQINKYPDLKDIPLPIRSYYKKKYAFDTVFAARGCNIGCDFCSVSFLYGRQYRLRRIEDVVKEIDSFRNFYYLLDDTVFGRPSTYKYYMDLYDRISNLKKRRIWTGQANIDAASSPEGRKVIAKAAEAGLSYAAIGIESINPEVLKKNKISKKISLKSADETILQMKENIKFIQQQGILISGWFAVGFEEDSIETYFRNLEFCLETNIIPILCPLEAIPGTPLFKRLTEEGKVTSSKSINIIHPTIKDKDVFETLIKTTKIGFSTKEILKRSLYGIRYSSRHSRNFNAGISDTITKFIFALITQYKIRKGIFGLANMH